MRHLVLSLVGACLLAASVRAQDAGKKARMGSETALVVIDIQQFYFEGGRVPLTGSVEGAAQARKVLDAFRARTLPVIHVRHVPKSVAIVDGEPADPQYRIRPEVQSAAGEKVMGYDFPAMRFTPCEVLSFIFPSLSQTR